MLTLVVLTVVANSALLPIAIAVAGTILFFWGLKSRRESQAVAQTPEVPIRSIASGPVHVYGKTTGDDRLVSPVTGAPCYYYKLQIERWTKQGDQERWVSFKNDTAQRSFYVDDGTARVLVDMQNAELDLPPTLRAEIGPRSAHYCKIDPSLGIGVLSENQLHAALVADWGQARAAIANVDTTVARAADKVLAAGQKMAEWGVSMNVDGVEINPGFVGESFRIQETCLLADRAYSVIGTCDKNPNPKNDQDKNVIRKGGGQTFLISLKTGEQLVSKLRLQGTVLMVLGVLLAIAGVAIAILKR